MANENRTQTGVWPKIKPFVNGGTSGMLATCVIQPIDMIKVRSHPSDRSLFLRSGFSLDFEILFNGDF